MPEQADEYFKQWRGVMALWAGVLAGPAAWALSQQVSYLFVTLDCSHGWSLAVAPVMLLTLLLAAGGAFVSWRNWRRAGRELPDEGGGAAARSRFMAACGLTLGVFSLLLIIAEWLPTFFYPPCAR
jgi:hypothetical protein